MSALRGLLFSFEVVGEGLDSGSDEMIFFGGSSSFASFAWLFRVALVHYDTDLVLEDDRAVGVAFDRPAMFMKVTVASTTTHKDPLIKISGPIVFDPFTNMVRFALFG